MNAFVLTSAGAVPVALPQAPFTGAPWLQRDDVNNTLQLQDAIDALQKIGGGTLYLPPGNYRVRELRPKSGVDLVGLGRVTFNLFNPGVDGYIARIVGQSAIAMENIHFDCTTEAGKENTVGCVEVTFDSATSSSDIDFVKCFFANAQNNAWLILRRVDNARIASCRFLNHLRETPGATHGLSIAESSNAIRVMDCDFDHRSSDRPRDPSKGHIGIDRATDVWIERCVIQNAPLNGITVEDNRESILQTIKIRDCAIRGCGNSGIQIEGNGLIDISVQTCSLSNNKSYGVRLASGKQFSANIEGCTFLDNSHADIRSGNSQLHINLKPGQIANVSNCIFRTASKEAGFVHLFYLNGEANVTNCSFIGATNGFGVYAPVDAEKQVERTTAAFRDLRFIDVGTPTFRLPQHFGLSWQYGSGERKIVETLLTKELRFNVDSSLVDIWTPTSGSFAHGAMLVSLHVLINSRTDAGAAQFRLFVKTGRDGANVLSPASQSIPVATTEAGGGDIVALGLSAATIAEQNGTRTRLHLRINTRSSRDNSPVFVTAAVEVLWSGFASAPVLI